VAIAYQVVLVVDDDPTDDNVAAPENLAGALNYDCVNCLTYALAQQLFLTLEGPLSEEAMAELDAVWQQIAEYGDAVARGEVPVDEVAATLDGYNQQILTIIEQDQPGTVTGDASSTASPTSTATSSTTSSPTAAESGTGETSPSATESGSTTTDGTTDGTTESPSSSPTGSETTSPSPSESPSGTTSDSTSTSSTTASDSGSETTSPSPTATTSPTG
jgi:putative peptide zinc metalloprotease protein